MNISSLHQDFLASCASKRRVLLLCCGVLVASACWQPALLAQDPTPVTAPADSPAPSPAASPSPAPVDPSLYLPQAVIQPSPTPNASSTSSLKSAGTNRAQPATAEVTPAPALEVCTPSAFAITYLSSSQTINVTLTYNVACAGMNVTLSPMDGGTINSQAGPAQVTLGTDGTATFQFQAPAAPGFYNVLAMLGGYQRALPFQVSAPAGAAN